MKTKQTNLFDDQEKKILHYKWFTKDFRISPYFYYTPKKRIKKAINEMLSTNQPKT